VYLGVRQIRDVRVATGTKVLGVDRSVELCVVNEQRNCLAGSVGLDERYVRVANETVSVIDGPRV
jgi:NifB/MoaA-like Fe-S oxidoreductase